MKMSQPLDKVGMIQEVLTAVADGFSHFLQDFKVLIGDRLVG